MTDITETVPLTRPIKAHGGEISEIKLKEPTARLFFSHGEPYKLKVKLDNEGDADVDFTFFNNVIAKFLVEMTGLDEIVLSSLSAYDYTNVRRRAVHMIVEAAGANPT